MSAGTRAYDIYKDIKAKGIAGQSTGDKVSNVLGIVGAGLDLTPLAPLGALVDAGSAVAGFFGEHKDAELDKAKEAAVGTAAAAKASAYKAAPTMRAPAMLGSTGIARGAMNASQSISGSSSF